MNMTSPYGPIPRKGEDRVFDGGRKYLAWLGVVVLGYALFGRGFAYLGIAPLFIGEITLALGMFVAWRFGRAKEVFRTAPGRVLVVFILWGAACTIPHLATYGVDAIRDAVVWIYAAFAVIVASLIIRDARHLRESLLRYRTFAYWFIGAIGILYVLATYGGGAVPSVPGSPNIPIIQAKGGDILVHLAGVTAFIVVGFMRQRWPLVALLVIDLGLVVVANRGGMVSFMVAGALLLMLKPPHRTVSKLSGAFIGLFLLAVLGGSLLTLNNNRQVSVDQLWENVKSVVGASDERSLDGTKTWRLEWWGIITEYTFTGSYFWTGKGYGINLATDDGFQVKEGDRLRSPHNGHMTVLARSGVPGLAIWTVLHLWWLAWMFSGWHKARRERNWAWVSFYAFIIPYFLAMLVNTSFDVYIEGPMGGIWFWCLWGFGLGAAHVQRQNPEVLSDGGPTQLRRTDRRSAIDRRPEPPRPAIPRNLETTLA